LTRWVRAVGLSLLVLGAGAISACAAATDLGSECSLVKKNPDGGLAVAILEGELPLTKSDYISFGSPLCFDVCVRDAERQRTGNNAAPALGYCSYACSTDSDCAGSGTQSGFECRSLLLDEATLEAICTADPAKCRSFNGSVKPMYCARPTSQ
jgi:hypothetical protein